MPDTNFLNYQITQDWTYSTPRTWFPLGAIKNLWFNFWLFDYRINRMDSQRNPKDTAKDDWLPTVITQPTSSKAIIKFGIQIINNLTRINSGYLSNWQHWDCMILYSGYVILKQLLKKKFKSTVTLARGVWLPYREYQLLEWCSSLKCCSNPLPNLCLPRTLEYDLVWQQEGLYRWRSLSCSHAGLEWTVKSNLLLLMRRGKRDTGKARWRRRQS